MPDFTAYRFTGEDVLYNIKVYEFGLNDDDSFDFELTHSNIFDSHESFYITDRTDTGYRIVLNREQAKSLVHLLNVLLDKEDENK